MRFYSALYCGRGELTFAISTGGNSPALARRLREELEAAYGEEYAGLLKLLGQLRGKWRKCRYWHSLV